MSALVQETEMPFVKNEGPYGLVICPSRELARQTSYEFEKLADSLEAGGFPKIRVGVAIGGTPVKETMEMIRRGMHIMVATPGRLMGNGFRTLDKISNRISNRTSNRT